MAKNQPQQRQTSVQRKTARVRRDFEYALSVVGPEGLEVAIKLITFKPKLSKREMVRRLLPYAIVRREARP